MAKKNYRADNTYLIEGNNGDNPKLMGRALSDGRDSLYLEFYFGKVEVTSKNGNTYQKNERRNELLGLYLWQAPRTPQERQQNKETLEAAKRIRFERGQELLERAGGYRLKKDRDINFHDWYRAYVNEYTKTDKNKIRRAHECFVDFLKGRNEYTRLAVRLHPDKITKEMMTGFTEYLQNHFNGETPHTLYARFKKVILAAVEKDVMRKNPCHGVSIKIDKNKLTKDVLSIDEVKALIATPVERENPNIRRAFIFCLYCGLRWCDVKDLTYGNVDFSNRVLRFEQSKTKGHSSASGVVIPLNEGLLKLIGKGERGDRIFPLPSHTMCLKALRHWTKHAGIEKHITWHCARHSFATNILSNGANIKTVANLLGHSDLRHTEKYTRVIDSLKEAAINSLPELKL
ncbi:site-specific integrase [uncultured Muribaculum sp.]|jgi:site-specific recombinase XerD|uniref:site-specific integrase n=1 Tax=uncultured Muribaculum sp. TaxID=1918613 RepID=UPI0025B01CAC|nr:site-specific integrase [uncultured Muribaculum sp.]